MPYPNYTLRASGQGGDFSTLSQAESQMQGEYTGADPITLACYNDDYGAGVGGGLVDDFTLFDGFGTDAVNNITIFTPESERFTGRNDGFALVADTITTALRITEGYVDIVGIRFVLSNANAVSAGLLEYGDGINQTLLDKCYFAGFSAGGPAGTFSAIRHGDASGAFTKSEVRNTVIDRVINVDFPTSTFYAVDQLYPSGAPKFILNNVTIYGNSLGCRQATVTNVVSAGNTREDFHTGIVFGNSNASEDGTASGTGAITGISTTDGTDFESPSTSDFRPVTSGQLDGTGFDNTAAGYTDDIAGNTRGPDWEIGAYEIVAAGPVVSRITSGAVAPPDFTTLSAWESWAQGEFGTTPDEYIAECYDDFPAGYLSDNCTIQDWGTTDATNHPTIRAAAGNSHGGVLDAGFTIRIQSPSPALQIFTEYTVVEDIQANVWGSGPNAIWVRGGNNYLNRCIAFSEAGNDGNCFNLNTGGPGNNTVRNSLAVGGGWGINPNTHAGNSVENCTAISCTSGIYVGGASTSIINCVAYDNTTDFPNWSAPSALDKNNASGDTTATDLGIGTINGVQAIDFVNYQADGTGDYTPSNGSALENQGYNLWENGTLFRDDITGTADVRPATGPWEIGAYQIQGAPPVKTEELYIKDGGVFVKYTPQVKVGGAWQEPKAYVKSGGAWVLVHGEP